MRTTRELERQVDLALRRAKHGHGLSLAEVQNHDELRWIGFSGQYRHDSANDAPHVRSIPTVVLDGVTYVVN